MKVLIVLFIAIPIFTSAQTNLQGKVFDSDTLLPIPFGTVDIYQDGIIVAGVETDIQGNYIFQNITPGVYDIVASYVGYVANRSLDVLILEKQCNSWNLDIKEGIVLNYPTFLCNCCVTPLIRFDEMTSGRTFTSEDIKSMPIGR